MKYVKIILTSLIVISTLVTLSGCGAKTEIKKVEDNLKNEIEESIKNAQEENKNEAKQEKSKETEAKEEVKKIVDKTPIDIKVNSSYYFVVNGKKYNVGDKVSSLESSNLKMNSTGAAKELQKYGYLISGGSILNSENKTVFDITPYNNGQEKVKASETVIGGFKLDKYGYKNFSGSIEICNGITIGTSIDDIKAVFGEPTKKTEATSYSGPTYTYDAKSNYMQFNFAFDKDGKAERISWQNFNIK